MVEWVTMASGKRMPCNIPDETKIPVSGAVVVSDDHNRNGIVVRGRIVIRTSHWATCPLAEAMRRSKGGRDENSR